MEGRRVQKVGYSTLTVSLPSNWAKDIGLKQGDLIVFTHERDGTLKLVPASMAKKKDSGWEYVINSDLCDENGLLERMIVGNYILGRDTLRVTSSKRISSIHIQEIRDAVKKLMGMGIIEEQPHQIVLQCSIDPAKFPIEMLMRRLSMITSTMQRESIEALLRFDMDLARETVRREGEADMIYWLIVRLLLSAQQDREIAEKIHLTEQLNIPDDRLIAKYMESVADYAEHIASNIIELAEYSEEVSRQIRFDLSQMGEMASSIFDKALTCLYSGDIKLANSSVEAKSAVEIEEEKLVSEFPKKIPNPYIIARLRAIAWGFRRIAEYGSGIALIAVNRAIEKPNKICEHIPLNPTPTLTTSE